MGVIWWGVCELVGGDVAWVCVCVGGGVGGMGWWGVAWWFGEIKGRPLCGGMWGVWGVWG